MTPLIIDIAERREVGQTVRTRQIASSKGSTSAEKRETGQSTRTGQRTSSKSNLLALSAAFNQLLLAFNQLIARTGSPHNALHSLVL